jgi:hypothetical protein
MTQSVIWKAYHARYSFRACGSQRAFHDVKERIAEMSDLGEQPTSSLQPK